jgi:hypothetical protein
MPNNTPLRPLKTTQYKRARKLLSDINACVYQLTAEPLNLDPELIDIIRGIDACTYMAFGKLDQQPCIGADTE